VLFLVGAILMAYNLYMTVRSPSTEVVPASGLGAAALPAAAE